MAELRRLFINQNRLPSISNDSSVQLLPKEIHYLTRVLRLKQRDSIYITNGLGSLWEATLDGNNKIRLNTSLKDPIQKTSLTKPLIGLAVVIPKNGFDEILRMSTEIGVNIFQPLLSKRSVSKAMLEEPSLRWESIINEAIEQSERLWKPEIRKTMIYNNWVKNISTENSYSIGVTRQNNYERFECWLQSLPIQVNEVWMTIGPEGGWTEDELNLAFDNFFKGVTFGENIMRTSTAAVSASQLMSSWKRKIK